MKTRFILMILLLGTIMNFTNCSKDDDVKNTPPSAPNLKFPTDKAIEQESSITLDWGDSVDPEKDDVSYKLYFSESQDELDDNIEASNLKTSSYQLNDLQYSTNYYWKVIAKDENDLESSSTIFSFSTKAKPNTAPTAPNLASPANEAVGVELDLSLIWEQSTDAEEDEISYDVYLGESENLSENELIASAVSELSYKPTDLELSKNYYWKVIAKDTKGASSSSSVFSFTITDIEMISVQGGIFKMGSNDGNSDDNPIHNVTLNSFEIGKYEVTQAQWEKVTGGNPSYFKGDNLPVETVSWNDVQTFITKLNEQTGLTYRLPTEAEWEFAARGGNYSNGYIYAGSNTIEDVAWHYSNSGNKTHDVGTKQANELGIYDMSGNVIEWCNDWYNNSYYKNSPSNNPQGPVAGSYRVDRGGGWSGDPCHVTSRNNANPNYGPDYVGFRLARSL